MVQINRSCWSSFITLMDWLSNQTRDIDRLITLMLDPQRQPKFDQIQVYTLAVFISIHTFEVRGTREDHRELRNGREQQPGAANHRVPRSIPRV